MENASRTASIQAPRIRSSKYPTHRCWELAGCIDKVLLSWGQHEVVRERTSELCRCASQGLCRHGIYTPGTHRTQAVTCKSSRPLMRRFKMAWCQKQLSTVQWKNLRSKDSLTTTATNKLTLGAITCANHTRVHERNVLWSSFWDYHRHCKFLIEVIEESWSS